MNHSFGLIEEKMRNHSISEEVINLFKTYYSRITTKENGYITNDELTGVCAGDINSLNSLSAYEDYGNSVLDRVVMVKLNGGLGTSMGMNSPKSLITIKDGMTFMDIILAQASGCNDKCRMAIPLVLMNSFNTEEETRKFLAGKNVPFVRTFIQNKYPKILRKTFEAASYPANPALEWNPPGHGDLYMSIHTSGLLKQLLQEGFKYAFISNSDNLGAVMDASILGFMAKEGFEFIMEVARRTPMDKKGGHLAMHKDGRYVLREVAQCPDEDLPLFQDIEYFCMFNTNNIWIDLEALDGEISRKGFLSLPMIVNPKRVNPRDSSSEEVFQIETAIGSGISAFSRTTAITVPGSRFIPIKKCADLLILWSDYHLFTEDCIVMANPERNLGPIFVALDDKFYGRIDDFRLRFPHGAPSLKHCASLKVTGDILFEKNVVITGDVQLENKTEKQVTIPEGSLLGDVKLVFGQD